MTGTDTIRDQANRRAVRRWLYFVAAMVFIMVVIGGLTRLTESGLSMVEWRPLLGWLPPLSEGAWQELFEKYKQFPQYRKSFPNLDLAGFKNIFWLEYIHRVWGRLIGVAFAVPFVWLLVRRRITKAMVPHLLLLFFLGGLQGALGWYMVASGLVDRPSVSHYRLTAHLSLAFIIYAYLLWFAFSLRDRSPLSSAAPSGAQTRAPLGWRLSACALALLIAVTIVSGGLVAGLQAGKIHNEFPLMGGSLIPFDYWHFEKPFWQNAVENPTAVQFHHRLLAILTYLGMLTYAFGVWRRRTTAPAPDQATSRHRVIQAALLLALAGTLQVTLGIATLLTFVPVSLGTMHQAGALLVITALVWLLHCLRRLRSS